VKSFLHEFKTTFKLMHGCDPTDKLMSSVTKMEKIASKQHITTKRKRGAYHEFLSQEYHMIKQQRVVDDPVHALVYDGELKRTINKKWQDLKRNSPDAVELLYVQAQNRLSKFKKVSVSVADNSEDSALHHGELLAHEPAYRYEALAGNSETLMLEEEFVEVAKVGACNSPELV
jgi:hypothetical protein